MATAAVVPTTPQGWEVADILRDHAQRLRLSNSQAQAVQDIVACRTEQLGGHLEVCPDCGFSRGTYNSCRNRSCPKCQILKQALWAEAQQDRLLPTPHFQIVFTVPSELHRFFRRAPRVCFALLFDAVSETLLEVAKRNLKASIGFSAVLHTWNQKLDLHPHIHCLVPAGGLSLDGSRWIPTSLRFFLPIEKLRTVFRAKLLAKLEQALRAGRILGDLEDALASLRRTPKVWNVYVKAPLAGPAHVVRYLSRYVHRIAISNSRITDYDGQNVTFRYKDRADGNATAFRTVSGAEFARLFLQHVLPPRFVRIRHYGILATRRRKDLARCRELLGAKPAVPRQKDPSWDKAYERLFGHNPLLCPACKIGILVRRAVLPPIGK
jgi:hypothetical protein